MDELLDKITQREGDSFLADSDNIYAELLKHNKAYSNIIIKILSGIGGVLATAALLGFLLLAGIYQSESGMLILGLLFVAGAIGISRLANHVFLDTAVLTLYICGFVLVAMGMGSGDGDAESVLLLCVVLSVLGIVLSSGFMMVTTSVLIFSGSLFAYCPVQMFTSYFALPIIGIGIVLFLITIKEPMLISRNVWLNKLYKPVQAGLFLSFLGGIIWILNSYNFGFSLGINDLRWISLSVDVMILVLVSKIISSLGVLNKKYVAVIYLSTLIILAPVFYAPGISASIFLLLLSVYYGYSVQACISIVALIYFITRFYYNLQMSLLVKAALLFFPGILMILVWYYFHKQLKKNEKI